MLSYGGPTSESRDSMMFGGMGSGQNSSGTKFLKTLLINVGSNVGQTFKQENQEL